jgi:branched-chain amino acid transport system permease protein
MTGLETFFQYIVAGLTRGSIYAIVAIGFNIIYSSTGIINFAQGEFVVLGAMVSITLSSVIPVVAAVGSIILSPGVVLALSISGGIVVAALFGALVEIVFVRYNRKISPLRGACLAFIGFLITMGAGVTASLPEVWAVILAIVLGLAFGAAVEFLLSRFQKEQNVLQLIIITIGVSILTREAMLHIWDEKVRALQFFSGSAIDSIAIGQVQFSPQVLWVLLAVGVVVLALFIFFKYTLVGKAMRAVSLDRQAAQLCGINARRLVTLSFVVSAAIGALAGAVTSPLTQTQYNMGAGLAINGFSVAILGGLGNSFAAALAGLLLGILESLTVAVIPNTFKDMVAIIILLGILFIKPSGLFGRREESTLKEF